MSQAHAALTAKASSNKNAANTEDLRQDKAALQANTEIASLKAKLEEAQSDLRQQVRRVFPLPSFYFLGLISVFVYI